LYLENAAGTRRERINSSDAVTQQVQVGITNLLLRSQEFENGSWVKTGFTVTANAASAPDGTGTADSLLETATTGVHALTQGVSLADNTKYTYSVYVKGDLGRDWCAIEARTKATGVFATQYVNLSTG